MLLADFITTMCEPRYRTGAPWHRHRGHNL